MIIPVRFYTTWCRLSSLNFNILGIYWEGEFSVNDCWCMGREKDVRGITCTLPSELPDQWPQAIRSSAGTDRSTHESIDLFRVFRVTSEHSGGSMSSGVILRVWPTSQVESSTPVGGLCRQLGAGDATFYAWKKKYAHLGSVNCDGSGNSKKKIADCNGSSPISRSTNTCSRRQSWSTYSLPRTTIMCRGLKWISTEKRCPREAMPGNVVEAKHCEWYRARCSSVRDFNTF